MVRIIDHGSWTLRSDDEGLHTPGPERLWNESYYFDFATADGSLGGYVRLGLYPNWNRAWYWACLVGRDRPLVLIADNDAPLPSGPIASSGLSGGGTKLVTEGPGYAATQETPRALETARLTLEAAAAAVLPDPSLAYATGIDRLGTAAAHRSAGGSTTGSTTGSTGDSTGGSTGSTTAFGLDLEWSTSGGVYPYRDMARYEIPCRVAGTIRVGDERIELSGYGQRDHSWGERDWWNLSWLWTSGRLSDGTAFHGVQANLGFPMPWPSFVLPPDGVLEHRDGFRAATRFGSDGLPAASELAVPGLPLTAVPTCFAPIAMTSPDDRPAHFPRALCRFESPDGRVGHGWTEWHQPPGWKDHDWSGPHGPQKSDGSDGEVR